MLKNFGFKIEKAREKMLGPRTIEFENGIRLEVEMDGNEPTIRLMQKGRELLDLKSFVPEGTEIRYNPKELWQADIDEKTQAKKIEVGKFKGVDCLLSFFHEVGHIHDAVSVGIIRDLSAKSYYEKMNDKDNSYPKERLRALKEEREEVVRAERSAWAYSLRTVRKIEREYGIKVLEKMGKAEDVKNFINGYLNSYEETYLKELRDIDIYTTEDMKKLFDSLDKKEAA